MSLFIYKNGSLCSPLVFQLYVLFTGLDFGIWIIQASMSIVNYDL